MNRRKVTIYPAVDLKTAFACFHDKSGAFASAFKIGGDSAFVYTRRDDALLQAALPTLALCMHDRCPDMSIKVGFLGMRIDERLLVALSFQGKLTKTIKNGSDAYEIDREGLSRLAPHASLEIEFVERTVADYLKLYESFVQYR